MPTPEEIEKAQQILSQAKKQKKKYGCVLAASIAAMLFGLFMLISIFGGISTDNGLDPGKVVLQKPTYELTASALSREYNANKVAADNKYKGKVIVVTGRIEDIGKDLFDNAYITLRGIDEFNTIQCTFTELEKNSISRLSKKQLVRVKGEVSGLIIMSVMVNKCGLVE